MKKLQNIMRLLLCLVCCSLLCACQRPPDFACITEAPTPEPTQSYSNVPLQTESGLSNTQNPTATPTETSTAESTINKKIAMKPGDVYRIFVWRNTEENKIVLRDSKKHQHWLDFQQKYGVTVTWVANQYNGMNPETADIIMKSVCAGEPIADIYDFDTTFLMMDVVLYKPQGHGLRVSPNSIFEDLSKYSEYTNFDDSEYWDQEAARKLGYIGGIQLAVVPYVNGWDAVKKNQVNFFNKKIVAEAGYSAEQIYTLYKNGEWTFDKFREVAIACTDADNGIYGTAVCWDAMTMLSLITANNASILSQNDSGVQRFTANSKEAVYSMNFFLDMCLKDKCVNIENDVFQREEAFFKDGKIAMMLTCAERVREGEGPRGGAMYQREDLEYGIVLPPKGPNASDYISEKNDITAYGVLKGHKNIAGVVQCLELYFRSQYLSDYREDSIKCDSSIYFPHQEEDLQVLCDAVKKTRIAAYMPYWYETNDSVNLFSNVVGYVPIWLDGLGNVQDNMNSAKEYFDFSVDKLFQFS